VCCPLLLSSQQNALHLVGCSSSHTYQALSATSRYARMRGELYVGALLAERRNPEVENDPMDSPLAVQNR
jgi:hypothetical protein